MTKLGYVYDFGRVLTTTGAWLRYRDSSPDFDFYPFDNKSLVKSEPNTGTAFAVNKTIFLALPMNRMAGYICERWSINQLIQSISEQKLKQ